MRSVHPDISAPDAFDEFRVRRDCRLVEMAAAAPGEETAALAFALGWGRSGASGHLLFWSAPRTSFAEHGVPYAEGLAQFGIDLGAFLIAATRTQIDALWAAEQALTLPGAFVLCTIAPAKKPLDLIATRRLFLAAKKNKSRCALLRFDIARASAAELRFEISSAPGESALCGLGPPAFDVRLTRNRAGPAGGTSRLQWSAYEHAFRTISRPLDGAVLPVPADRPPAASRARAL
jgi:protein ImuA